MSVKSEHFFDLQETYMVSSRFEEGLTNSEVGCSRITEVSAIFTIFGGTEEF